MEHNNLNKIGKIFDYNKETGTGKILTNENTIYFFVINDNSELNLKNGDLVTFRGEKVLDTNRAYFVKKYVKND